MKFIKWLLSFFQDTDIDPDEQAQQAESHGDIPLTTPSNEEV